MDKRQKLAFLIDIFALVIMWRVFYPSRTPGAGWYHTARACQAGAYWLGQAGMYAELRYRREVAQ